jgi:hypothetical protein
MDILFTYIVFCNDILGRYTKSGVNDLIEKYCHSNCKKCEMRIMKSSKLISDCFQVRLRRLLDKYKRNE